MKLLSQAKADVGTRVCVAIVAVALIVAVVWIWTSSYNKEIRKMEIEHDAVLTEPEVPERDSYVNRVEPAEETEEGGSLFRSAIQAVRD